MNAAQNFQTNETVNPLFAKMQERFCANGTIAEQMAIEAGLMKKRSRKMSVSRRNAATKECAANRRKAIFNLKNCGIVSMCVLFLSVLFFSGASIDGLQKSFSAERSVNSAVKTSIMAEEQEVTPLGTAYSFEDASVTNI